MLNKICLAILFVSVTFVSGCVNKHIKQTEPEQYNEMRQGTLYRAYQKISIKSMRPLVKEYNAKLAKENKTQSGDAHIHSLLALIWVGALQPKYALAEMQYALQHAVEPKDRYAALAVQSLAMHEQGWHMLAKQPYNESNAIRKNNSFSTRYKNTLLLVNIAGGALAVKEGDIAQTISAVNELGVMLNKPWIIKLADSTQSLHRGATTKAVTKLDEIKSDPGVSNKTRKRISKMQNIIKGGGKNIKSDFGKAVISTVTQEAIDSHDLTAKILGKLPVKYRTKIAKHMNK